MRKERRKIEQKTLDLFPQEKAEAHLSNEMRLNEITDYYFSEWRRTQSKDSVNLVFRAISLAGKIIPKEEKGTPAKERAITLEQFESLSNEELFKLCNNP